MGSFFELEVLQKVGKIDIGVVDIIEFSWISGIMEETLYPPRRVKKLTFTKLQ